MRICHVHVVSRNLHLADSHFLHFAGDLDGVVDEEAAVVPIVWVEGHAQKAPLVPQPGRGHHLAAQVQVWCLQSAAVPQVDPHKAHLLSHKHAVCFIAAVQHQHGVPQVVGHFRQAQLEAAARVLGRLAQVAVEARTPQDVGIAVVLVRQLHRAAKSGGVSLCSVVKLLVHSQIPEQVAARLVDLGTVFKTKAR